MSKVAASFVALALALSVARAGETVFWDGGSAAKLYAIYLND